MLDRRTVMTLLALVSGLLAAPAGAAVPWFTGIGDLPGGAFESSASAVSDTGIVVGFGTDGALSQQAVLWTAAAGLVPLPVDAIAGIDVSAEGSTVLLRGVVEDFVWTPTGGVVGLGDLQLARALSADGTTVVGRRDRLDLVPARSEAFRWTLAGGVEGLGFLPHSNPSSQAYAVSADGEVAIGDATNQVGAPGFLWTAGSIAPLEPIVGQGQPRFARAMSSDGTTVAGLASATIFVWSETDGYTYLADFDTSHGKWPRDLDAGGSVLVGGSVSHDHPTAFHWTAADGMRPLGDVLADDYGLDVDGWILTDALGISPNGRYIVGVGTNPDGAREGFVAFLGSPSCGLGAELAFGLPLLALLRRRVRG